MTNILSLESILSRDKEDLTKLNTGEFKVEKLGGVIPWTAVNQDEYKDAKKGCLKFAPARKGQKQGEMEFDDDKLKINLIVEAVHKDPRSDFTFANKQLLEKLGVTTAAAAASVLLSPGEIHNWAIEIQDASGFSSDSEEETADEIKN